MSVRFSRKAALAALAAVMLGGCAARRAGDVVAGIDFVGNDPPPGLTGLLAPQTDRALRNTMGHDAPDGLAALLPGAFDPVYLDRRQLDEDAWRIEVWYANHGYFDARFVGWQIRPLGRPGADLRRYRVRGQVEQGAPSRLAAAPAVRGLEGLQAPLRKRVLAAITLAEGDVWDTDAWRASERAMTDVLREQSYAHAKVTSEVVVRPEDHAVDLTFVVATGPVCRYGPVFVPRVPGVPDDAVRAAVPFVEGDNYRTSDLGRARDRLFALRVFSVVEVEPDLRDPTAATVPVRVRLSKGLVQQVAVGPEIQVEPGRAAAVVGASWTHDHVAKRLWRFESELRAGAASLTALAEDDAFGLRSPTPVADARARIELPRTPVPPTTVALEAEVATDIKPGYSYWSPGVSPSIAWKVFPGFSMGLSYRLEYFEILEATVDIDDIVESPRGTSAEEPYYLSALEQTFSWDSRNDPIRTSRGWYWSVALTEAGGPFGGRYAFLRARGEVRAWRPVIRLFGARRPDLLVAARLGGGFMVPPSDGGLDSIPLDERLYLGGGTTVRGWAPDRLGPVQWSDPACASDGAIEGCELVPVGGLVQAFGNFEVRKKLPWGLGAVLFVDLGRVWGTWAEILESPPLPSLGLGLRYDSPIGPLRADLAWRLGTQDDIERPAGDPDAATPSRIAVHFGITEAF